jgi:hypothetical protein
LDFEARFDLVLPFGFATALGWRRSGNSALPAARFHSSKVSGEMSPLTNSSANFLRCALLLIGMVVSAVQRRFHDRVSIGKTQLLAKELRRLDIFYSQADGESSRFHS